MKLSELLDELKEEILGSPKTVFSNKKTVDTDIVLEILEDIQKTLPKELEQAKQIIEDKQKILDEAKAEADNIIKSAEAELAERVADDEIVKAAEIKAKDLMDMANNNAKEITLGSKEYADDIMRELEKYFVDYLKLIRKNRLQLSGKRKK